METRPPRSPSSRDTAVQKIRLAEDGGNTRDPVRVALACRETARWRHGAAFLVRRPAGLTALGL